MDLFSRVVAEINATEFPVHGSLGYGDDETASWDYELGYYGYALGLVRYPGMSYWTQLGYDNAESGAPYNVDIS